MLPDRNLKSPSPPSAEPGTVLLDTERLILRRFMAFDAPSLAVAANHTSIFNNLRDRMPSPYTLADAEAYVNGLGERASVYPNHVGIFLKPNTLDNPSAESVLIGSVGIKPGDDVAYRSWELGYWVTPPAWGKGYATEAVGAFVRWIFVTWPSLNRIEAQAYGHNTGSAGVLTKCGFTKEGVKRGSVEKCGVILDEMLFGIVRSDLGL
ncbi:putative N-acetyltransferase YoaA-like protein [Cladobotryum mycophilum]|uniref:N-acetyltransferase YoaA-like protein n=1 Tax=Cladobotryum mycophilum TaxID=491253 RepID=A0ABR0SRD4_9HYPO